MAEEQAESTSSGEGEEDRNNDPLNGGGANVKPIKYSALHNLFFCEPKKFDSNTQERRRGSPS